MRLIWQDWQFPTNRLEKLQADSTAKFLDSNPSLQIAELTSVRELTEQMFTPELQDIVLARAERINQMREMVHRIKMGQEPDDTRLKELMRQHEIETAKENTIVAAMEQKSNPAS